VLGTRLRSSIGVARLGDPSLARRRPSATVQGCMSSPTSVSRPSAGFGNDVRASRAFKFRALAGRSRERWPRRRGTPRPGRNGSTVVVGPDSPLSRRVRPASAFPMRRWASGPSPQGVRSYGVRPIVDCEGSLAAAFLRDTAQPNSEGLLGFFMNGRIVALPTLAGSGL
jgi:hypothetical protein